MAEPSLTLLLVDSLRAHHNGMRKLMSIVAMAMTLLAGGASAVEIGNLYGGQAIVTGIFEPERTRGLRQILLDVLVKVSAEPRLIDDPRVQPLLDRAKDFMTSYEYEDRMKGTPVRDEQGTRDRPYDLRITFDQAKIDAALTELGLKPWTSDRPRLAVLVMVHYPAVGTTPGNAFALTADGQNGLGQRHALEAAATRRGMLVVLPPSAMAANVTIAMVNGAMEPFLRLAADLRSDDALVGQMFWRADGAFWHTSWALQTKNGPRSWSVDSPSFDEAFRNGVGEAAATLAGRR
jgi:hypothetical protein